MSSAAGRPGRCDRASAEAVQVYEAVRFALRRINQSRGQVDGRIVSDSFLPGVKLGQCRAACTVTRWRPTDAAGPAQEHAQMRSPPTVIHWPRPDGGESVGVRGIQSVRRSISHARMAGAVKCPTRTHWVAPNWVIWWERAVCYVSAEMYSCKQAHQQIARADVTAPALAVNRTLLARQCREMVTRWRPLRSVQY